MNMTPIWHHPCPSRRGSELWGFPYYQVKRQLNCNTAVLTCSYLELMTSSPHDGGMMLCYGAIREWMDEQQVGLHSVPSSSSPFISAISLAVHTQKHHDCGDVRESCDSSQGRWVMMCRGNNPLYGMKHWVGLHSLLQHFHTWPLCCTHCSNVIWIIELNKRKAIN